MQPQVSLTSGRTHTRAAPGDDMCMYVCRAWEQVPSRVNCHGATRAWPELISCIRPSLSPWIGKSIHAQWPTGGQSLAHIDHICATCPLFITSPHLGTVKPYLGTWPSRVQPHLGTQRAEVRPGGPSPPRARATVRITEVRRVLACDVSLREAPSKFGVIHQGPFSLTTAVRNPRSARDVAIR